MVHADPFFPDLLDFPYRWSYQDSLANHHPDQHIQPGRFSTSVPTHEQLLDRQSQGAVCAGL